MGIRVYKPTSAGRRNASVSDFAELTPGYKPEKSLLRPKRKTGGRNNQYAFEIHREATKLDVKRAVEELFGVKVEKVRTQTRKGKMRRYRFRYGRTSDWKKAVVHLHEDHRIDFF